MLVNEIKTYTVQIGDKEVELRLDFAALTKMHKEYGNAFLLIHSYAFENDFEKLPAIIACMANEKLTEEEVREHMTINMSLITVLSSLTLDLLNTELMDTSEFKIKSEVKKNLESETGT